MLTIEEVGSIDTETTGWDLSQASVRATQISLVRNTLVDPWSAYLLHDEKTLMAMGPDAIGITGITPELVFEEGIGPEEALEQLLIEWEGGNFKVVASHNWKFDRAVLKREFETVINFPSPFEDVPYIDTLRLVREAYDDGWDGYGGSKLPDFKLATSYHGIVPRDKWVKGRPHGAVYDAEMVIQLVEHFLGMGLTVEDMVEISKTPFVPRYCPMGKDRGQKGLPWHEVDTGFLGWMAKTAVWKDDVGLEAAVLVEMERRGMI